MDVYLKAKITIGVTGAKFEYEGSLTLDADIMDRLGVRPYEQVYVNGKHRANRIMTYILPGERDSGICEMNGGAANFFKAGDIVHLLFFTVTDKPVKPIVL